MPAPLICNKECFQFLGIPPKGELPSAAWQALFGEKFPISRDPPEGGTYVLKLPRGCSRTAFPISRDPPEGGTKIPQKRASLGTNDVSNF